MEISVSKEQAQVPVMVFHVNGTIGASEEQTLIQRAQDEQAVGMQNLLLDLAEVEYMSSSGLRAVHAIYMMLRSGSEESDTAVSKGIAAGTYMSPHLKLANVNKKVNEVLHTSGFDMFLEIHEGVEEALAAFG